MGRPLGIIILGIVMIAAGLGFAAAGFVFFFMASTGASATAAAAGVIFLLFGALHVVLAVGIFRLRNMARVFTIFLFLLIGAGACLGLLATLLSYSHVGLVWNISLLALDALALWYLFRHETKEAFK